MEMHKKEIRCNVCMKTFNNPIILPCGHTFVSTTKTRHVEIFEFLRSLNIDLEIERSCAAGSVRVRIRSSSIHEDDIDVLNAAFKELLHGYKRTQAFSSLKNFKVSFVFTRGFELGATLFCCFGNSRLKFIDISWTRFF